MRPTYKRSPEPEIALTEHDIEANGLRIHYVEAGAGEPLLLLHGALRADQPVVDLVRAFGPRLSDGAAYQGICW